MDMQDMGNILREAVNEAGLSMKSLSEMSGVNRISLMRFMRGDTDLNLSAASRLADFFGLELVPVNKHKPRQKRT